MATSHYDDNSAYVLGLDLGTTSVKAALISVETGEPVKTITREMKADVTSEVGSQGHEQDVQRIILAIQFCVSSLPKEKQMRVIAIGVSGQMHGVMLWNGKESWHHHRYSRYDSSNTSHLYTWQDERCSDEFISSMPQSSSHLRLATGHGCATLLWLQQHSPDLIEKFSCAGTIQDYLVAMLCDRSTPLMSVQNAASWGYYNTDTQQWDKETLEGAHFPVHLLPEVQPAGSLAGQLTCDWYSIREGTLVTIALGDLQCSILSSVQNTHDAVLNLSTSAQLAFPIERKHINHKCSNTIEYFPYFDNRYIAVAASLTGGNVLAAFIKMLQQWTHTIGGVGIPQSSIWDRVLSEGSECSETDLTIVPTIHGERHAPNVRASVHGINTSNLSLGNVCRALCRGVITNLYSMMSSDFLIQNKISRIVGNGSALLRNSVMKQEIEKIYQLPVTYSIDTNAAVGAAMSTLHNYKKIRKSSGLM